MYSGGSGSRRHSKYIGLDVLPEEHLLRLDAFGQNRLRRFWYQRCLDERNPPCHNPCLTHTDHSHEHPQNKNSEQRQPFPFWKKQTTNHPCIIMSFRLTWNRRRRSSLPSSSDNTNNSRSLHGHGEPSHEVVLPCTTTTGRTIYCQRFRLRWVDERCQECAVCYSKFKVNCIVALLPCGHYYCHGCMDQWFYSNNTSSSKCPLCRYDCSKPLKEEQEDCGYFYGMVPTVAMVGDSSSSTDASSSSSSSEGRDNDLESFVCSYQVDFRAAATSSSTARTAMTAASMGVEHDPLASLVEKYGQRDNFHLILSKALKAKQARECQQCTEATAAVFYANVSSPI